MNYYVIRNGQTYGPYSEEVIRKYMSEGSMLGTDMARTEGMSVPVQLSQLLAGGAAPQPPHVPESKPEYGASATPPQPQGPKPPAFHPQPGATGGMSKKQYLDAIRHDSAYPTYRGFIGVIAILGYILAAVVGLGAVGTGLFSLKQSGAAGLAIIVGGLIYAALLYLMARFFKEAALILADIGDSTVDSNARSRSGQ